MKLRQWIEMPAIILDILFSCTKPGVSYIRRSGRSSDEILYGWLALLIVLGFVVLVIHGVYWIPEIR